MLPSTIPCPPRAVLQGAQAGKDGGQTSLVLELGEQQSQQKVLMNTGLVLLAGVRHETEETVEGRNYLNLSNRKRFSVKRFATV